MSTTAYEVIGFLSPAAFFLLVLAGWLLSPGGARHDAARDERLEKLRQETRKAKAMRGEIAATLQRARAANRYAENFARTVREDCRLHGQVPVHLATGEHVADWCPQCSKTTYVASWVSCGE